MISHVWRRLVPQRSLGQGLSEFALVLPVLLLMLLGLFDLGRAVYAYSTISDAARSGSRVAIVDQDLSLIQSTAANQAVALGISPAVVSVAYRNAFDLGACATVSVGSCVAEVTVPYTFNAITPIIGSIVGAIHMSSTTRLPIEAVCTGSACPPTY